MLDQSRLEAWNLFLPFSQQAREISRFRTTGLQQRARQRRTVRRTWHWIRWAPWLLLGLSPLPPTRCPTDPPGRRPALRACRVQPVRWSRRQRLFNLFSFWFDQLVLLSRILFYNERRI